MGTIRILSSHVSSELVRKLGISDLAEVLFASMLQESDRPSPQQIRAAVEETLTASGGDCGPCAAWVAQEAGDHPETYVRRMRWSMRSVETAYMADSLIAA